jgi:hypothetical protein
VLALVVVGGSAFDGGSALVAVAGAGGVSTVAALGSLGRFEPWAWAQPASSTPAASQAQQRSRLTELDTSHTIPRTGRPAHAA